MTEPVPDGERETDEAENARVSNRVRLFDMLLIAQHVNFSEDDERKALMDACLRKGCIDSSRARGDSAG